METATIRCGKCGNRHYSVNQVRECYFPPRPSANPALGAVEQKVPALSGPTKPQLKYIEDLGGDLTYARKLSVSEASEYIASLKRAKKEKEVSENLSSDRPATQIPLSMLLALPDGYYAARQDDNDEYDFFRVSRPKSGKYKDCLKIQTQHSELLKDALIIWPGDRVYVYNRSIEANLLLVVVDPRGCGVAYGRKIGRCMMCGKTLTDGRSRYFGIGPDCEKDHPEVIAEVTDMFGPYVFGKEVE